MSTIITNGTDTITPDVVDGYAATREGRSIIHPIVGISDADVTLRPASRRTGTLRLVFAAEADAAEAEAMHAAGGVLTLDSTVRSSIGMSYVVPDGGRVTRELDGTTRNAWIVSVDFQEVAP